MPKKYYSLSPEQCANQRISIETIMEKAQALPDPPAERVERDFAPLVVYLRDEKQLTWTAIASWMRDNTEFYRSQTKWKQIYDELKAFKPKPDIHGIAK